jgi:hypothetical protein
MVVKSSTSLFTDPLKDIINKNAEFLLLKDWLCCETQDLNDQSSLVCGIWGHRSSAEQINSQQFTERPAISNSTYFELFSKHFNKNNQ